MAFQLRGYQQDMIDRARVKLRTVKRVLLQAPTGAGKTALAVKMLETASGKGLRCGFVVHRQELIDQTISAFEKINLRYGAIAAGFPAAPMEPVQICSIDTLKHRIDKVQKPFDFMIWDEAHHSAAAGWTKVMQAFPAAHHVGLTATPERLDGKGLDTHFNDIVLGPKVSWLIENGFLANYRAYAPAAPDLDGVHTKMGDYVKSELAQVMDKPTITGDAIKHYLRLARGKRAVVFCINIEHSQHVAAQFKAAGVMAWHLDGNTPRGERQQVISAFRAGHIQVLTNVDLFGEGFDLPAIEATIMLRPTSSLALFLQQVGRCLRPTEGKDRALILDHAGNMLRHGLPDDDRDWKLEGRDKKKKEAAAPIVVCPSCFASHRPARSCPECGHAYGQEGGGGRQVEHRDGELVEVDKEALRRQRMQEQGMATSIDQLVALAKQRGYRHPEKWAAHVFTGRAAAARQRDRRYA